MWKEKYYFALIVFLSFILLLNPTNALPIIRIDNSVGFTSLPISRVDYNVGSSIESLMNSTAVRIDNNCYNVTLKFKTSAIETDYNSWLKGTMTNIQFKTKYLATMTNANVLSVLQDWNKGEPILLNGSGTVTGTLTWKTPTVKICFKIPYASGKAHIGRFSEDVFVNDASVDLFVTPETVYPYHNDWATGLHYYSQQVKITNNSSTPIQLDANNFGGVGIGYTLMADYNLSDDENNYYNSFKEFNSSIFVDANKTQNVYFNYSTTKDSGKWDFHFYWKDINGTIKDYLIDPYWTTSVSKTASNSMFADWNKSFFVYQRSSDASWEANGELDWNLASRNDTNYTSWKAEYSTDYNLPSDTNLVGLWHFNNITKNDNVVTGKVGNALNFTSTTTLVSVPASTSLNNACGITQPASISLWLKTSDQGNKVIAEKSTGAKCYSLQLTGVGGKIGYATNGAGSTISGDKNVADGQWHLITGTFDGNTTIKLYIDGNLNATNGSGAGVTDTNPFTIGARITPAFGVIGLIDQVRVWNIGLSATDVNRMFIDENGGSQAPSADLNRTNLIGEWLFDENSNSNWGSLTPDTSGQANNGSEINMLGAVTPDASGNGKDLNIQNGGYLSIDGTNTGLWKTNSLGNTTTGFAVAQTASDFNIIDNLTFSAWIYPTNVTSYHVIMSKSATGVTGTQYELRTNGTTLEFLASNGTSTFNTSASSVIIINTWSHITAVIDNKVLKTYVNGVAVGSTATITGSQSTTSELFGVGVRRAGSTKDLSFIGKIEEPMIWSRALSASEVLTLYQKQKSQWMDANLVGYWKFNLASGTTVFDSARGNNGTLTGSGANINAQGMWDTNALALSGTTQYVTLDGVATVNNTPIGTISLWAKPSSFPSPDGFLIGGYNGGNTRIYILDLPSPNRFGCSMGNGATRVDSNSVMQVYPGQWYHLAVVWNNGNYSCYINGISAGSSTYTTDAGTGLNKFKIGSLSGGNAEYFPGNIDEVKLWNRALTANEIQSDYNQWMNSKFVDSNVDTVGDNVTLGTVTVNKNLNYNFNKQLETFGDSSLAVNELSGSSSMGASSLYSDANLVGLWHFNNITRNDNVVTGKVGNDLNWMTTTQYVSIPTIPSINGTAQSKSISFWIKTTSTLAQASISSQTNSFYFGLGGYTNCVTVGKIAFWGGGSYGNNACTTVTINDGNWHFITGVWNKDLNNNLIYRDGVLDGNVNYPLGENSSVNSINIGNSSGGITGLIDNYRIWNVALTSNDVNRIYQDELNGTIAPNIDLNRTNLVGEWLMDENATSNWGSLTPDTSGNNNNGSEINMLGAVTPDTTSNHNDANLHNGTYLNLGTNYTGLWKTNAVTNTSNTVAPITVNSSTSLNPTSGVTIAGWINSTSIATEQAIASKTAAGAAQWEYDMEVYQSKLLFQTNNSKLVQGTQTLLSNTWYHVVATFDKTNVNMYINGVLDKTDATFSGTGLTANTNPLYIGSYGYTSGSFPFLGKLEEITIWSRSLSATEVANLYNSQAGNFQDPNMVSLWHLNDKNAQGYFLNSVTGNRDANTSNDTNNTTGLWGTQDINFIGVNTEGVAVGTNPADYNYVSGNTFTISAWVKPNTANQDTAIISKGYFTSAGDNKGYVIRSTSTGLLYFEMYANSQKQTGGFPYTVGKWQHIVAVYSGTAGSLYVNGIQYGTSTTGSITPATQTLHFGIDTNAGYFSNRPYNGELEDVAIWSTALTSQQISDLYRKGVSRMDLNVIAYSDALGNNPIASTYITDANNNQATTVNITGTYFNPIQYFKQGTGFDNNAGVNFMGAFLQDTNLYYYDECHPLANYDWQITQNQICQNKKIDINSGIIRVSPNKYLQVIDCNTHAYMDSNTFFGVNLIGSNAQIIQTRGCTQYWTKDSNIRTNDCNWWN